MTKGKGDKEKNRSDPIYIFGMLIVACYNKSGTNEQSLNEMEKRRPT
jgi:hypothetical protein